MRSSAVCWAAGVVAASILAVAAPSRGDALIAYGGHDVPAGGSLHQVDPGTNLNPWDVQNGSATTFQLAAQGLSYQYLQTSGLAAVGGGEYLSAGFGLTLPGSGDSTWTPYIDNGNVGKEGTTLWASVLVNNFTDSNDFRLAFHTGGVTWAPDSGGFNLGLSGGKWALTQRSGSAPSAVSNVKLDTGLSTLMVLKMDFIDATTDRVSLYVNPTPGGPLPAAPDAVLDSTANLSFRAIGFYPNQNKLTGAVDEFRFGDSFAAVTPRDENAASTPVQRMRSYFIGNSVTDSINAEGLRQMALARAQVMPWGRNVILGSPLDNIVNNPGQGFITAPYNGWNQALPNFEWDFVSLQPFDRSIASDTQSIQTFIDSAKANAANNDTQFAIYQRWMRTETGPDGLPLPFDYQKEWDGLDPTTLENERRQFFTDLLTSVRNANPDLVKPIVLVPVGDVFYELDKRMEAGQVPGFTDIAGVYIDGIHMGTIPGKGNVGGFIASSTFYAVQFKQSPVGLPYDMYGITDAALAAAIQDAVWDVVSAHPYAGIPEPSSIAVLAFGGLLILRRRR